MSEISNELPKAFESKGIEDKWYKSWSEGKYFKPVDHKNGKKPYTILMPPPNVTGKLHIGHALDHTIQDILIRFKRMQKHETLWIPGQDHASIATQAKVEQKILEEQGKTKHEIGREEFLKEAWKWKEEFGGKITEQIKKIGDSCDWDYFTFTMDETPNQAVKKFFTDLYNEGLIYQADYIVNWDPKLQSAISDAEVIHKEVQGHFYHIHYQVKDSNQVLEIATTRPETLFGDTAIAVNPNDDRFEHLIGKKAIVPICNREIPIVADKHVDMELGTGCLKVTPGHDFNDYEIGKRNNLETLTVLNKDGTFNEHAKAIEGLNVKEGRKQTIKLLKELDSLADVKDHKNQIGHSERSGAVVEPMVSKQWFVNSDQMAQNSVDLVESEKMKFFPKGWENTYFSYQKNPRPWCISRQLWWGHQIPVYDCQVETCQHQWASETDPAECPKCKNHNFKQDPDVLDTWFSSALFPLCTLGWPDEKKMREKGFDKFYPSSVLVTGFDIIFFWVARMMMVAHKVTDKAPFSDTYIHAIVRDKNGVKMSKSVGNVLDPLDIIDQYGCDALRFTLAVSSGYNRNINLDPAKIEGYRNFVNKLWNAFRFIHPYLENTNDQEFEIEDLHHHEKWILTELNDVIKDVTNSIDIYRFDDACNSVYQFVYEKFCSWFIEVSKGILNSNNENLKTQRANILRYCFREIVKLVHPVTPFITEEMWSYLKRDDEDLLIVQEYPTYQKRFEFEDDKNKMDHLMEIVTAIRNLRNNAQLKPKDEVRINLFTDDEKLAKYFYQSRGFIKELAGVIAGDIKDKSVERPTKSIMKATAHTEVFISLDGLIDIEGYVARLKKDQAKTQKEYDKVSNKLKNPKFVENAPDDIIEKVKEEAHAYKEKLDSLTSNIERLFS